MVLIPVLIAYFRKVRQADRLSVRACVKAGIAYGVGFGLLFLMYSGWFVWFAPGVVAAGVPELAHALRVRAAAATIASATGRNLVTWVFPLVMNEVMSILAPSRAPERRDHTPFTQT